YELLLFPSAAYIFLSIRSVFIFRFSDWVYLKMMPVFRNSLLVKSLAWVQSRPYSYFQTQFGGAIATRIGEMVDAVQTLFGITIYRLLVHFLALLVACYTIGKVVHPHLSLILIVCSLIFICTSYLLTKQPYVLAKNYLESFAILMGKLIDSI